MAQKSLTAPPPVTASFIVFPQKRKDEMRAYSLRHYGINSYRLMDPRLIIWHYTDSTTYASVYNTFADDVTDVQFHELPQVCTHFVITTHGTIHQLVPLNFMCRQVVGLNYTSLGLRTSANRISRSSTTRVNTALPCGSPAGSAAGSTSPSTT